MKIQVPRQEFETLHPQSDITWSLENIPAELKQADIIQWKQCYLLGEIVEQKPVKTPKRPKGGPTVDFHCDTFSAITATLASPPQAQDYQHFGFCFTDDDPYIAIDVDDLPMQFTDAEIPDVIRHVLTMMPTYAEISPSGQGLRLIYKTDKAALKHRKAADSGVDGFRGAVYIRNQFTTFTGHQHHLSTTSQIAYIDASMLEKLLMKPTNVVPIQTAAPSPTSIADAPTTAQLRTWLSRIPPSISNHVLKDKFYAIYRTFEPPLESPSDYEHWRVIAAAVHHGAAAAGQTHEGADIFDEWSANDEINYDGSDAARKKYYENPPKYDGTDITYLTLTRLYHATRPIWPYPRTEGTGKNKKLNKALPEQANMQNWRALIDHFDIKLRQNEITKEYNIHGNKQAVSRYFKSPAYADKEALEAVVHYFGQDNYFTTSSATVAKSFTRWWVGECTESYNPIKDWIDNAPDYDPGGGSYFQALWDTIILPEHERSREGLYRSYLKKSLMGVIRAHYHDGKFDATTGMVILQGPEQTYKSTWVRQLLPRDLSAKYLVPSQARADRSANIKELQLEAGVAQIWLKDECEELLRSGDAILKNFLVQETDAYRPLYATTPVQVPRKCIFFGTTNEPELPITDNGARRIQIIPIEKCDTTGQSEIDIVMVYKELLYEFTQTAPEDRPKLWVLSDEEISSTNKINSTERKADQEADILLKETFAFEKQFELADFQTTARGKAAGSISKTASGYMGLSAIRDAVRNQTGTTLTSAQLKRALKRVGHQWTNISRPTSVGNWFIDHNFAYVPKNKGAGNSQSGYLMPPLKSFYNLQEDTEIA